MTVALFAAAIITATLHAWWATVILTAMGCAYLYDLHLRQRQAERRQDRRCRAELQRREQETKR